MNTGSALDILTSLFTSLAGEEIYLALADSAEVSHALPNLDEAARFIEEQQARGIFVSTGTFQPGTARKHEHLLSVPVILLDSDLKDCLAHEGIVDAEQKVRQGSTTVLTKLRATHLRVLLKTLARAGIENPSAVIFSGNGHHVYLLLDFLDQRDIPRIRSVHKALVHKLNTLAEFSLFDKQVVDAGTRYFRMPGTYNTRSNPPRLVEVVQNSGPTFTIEQLERIAGIQPAPQQEEQSSDAGDSEAIASLLLPYWTKGKRHELALSLAGYLAKGGWSWEQAESLFRAIAAQVQDEEVKSRLGDLRGTYNRLAKGEEVKGFTALAHMLTAADLQQLEQLVNFHEIPIDATPTDEWPILHDDALYGLPGKIVTAISPHTEADPVALLVNLLVMFGNCVGPTAHFIVEFTKHYLRLFAVLVGLTAKGRKGQSMSALRHLFSKVDPEWLKDRVSSGVSTGEGLIFQVRDMRTGRNKEGEEVIVDAGVEDKRFLPVEEEFASVLKALAREGNTASAIFRQAWDTGDLHPLTKTAPIRATGAHISLLAHTTKAELLRLFSETEQANGFGNRIQWYVVKRSKLIPRPKGIPSEQLDPLVDRLQQAVDFARRATELDRDQDAEKLWEAIYAELSEGKPGMFSAITARAEAQVMRLACIYAVLDCSDVIKIEHLKAALALWKYSEQSARFVFGDALGDPIADEILSVLRRSPEGLTRTDIRDLFGRHRKAAEVGRALGALLKAELVRREVRPTKGRSEERWYATATEATEV